jgi:hypothetical protein
LGARQQIDNLALHKMQARKALWQVRASHCKGQSPSVL